MIQKNSNKDMITVANEVIWVFSNKSCDKVLSKDERLAYDACLRFVKAMADKLSDSLYQQMPKPIEHTIRNPWNEDDDLESEGVPA